MFELMFEGFLAEVQPQTEPEWRECFEALQEAKNSLLSVAGVSPMQIVFGRKSRSPSGLPRRHSRRHCQRLDSP